MSSRSVWSNFSTVLPSVGFALASSPWNELCDHNHRIHFQVPTHSKLCHFHPTLRPLTSTWTWQKLLGKLFQSPVENSSVRLNRYLVSATPVEVASFASAMYRVVGSLLSALWFLLCHWSKTGIANWTCLSWMAVTIYPRWSPRHPRCPGFRWWSQFSLFSMLLFLGKS